MRFALLLSGCFVGGVSNLRPTLTVASATDAVELSWSPRGSTEILRDGVVIATVDGDAYRDTEAEPSTYAPPGRFVATTDDAQSVKLSWDAPLLTVHSYRYSVRSAGRESDGVDAGRADTRPLTYAISGADFAVTTDTLAAEDASAPPPALPSGSVTAVYATAEAWPHVAVWREHTSAERVRQPRAYTLRALADAQPVAADVTTSGALAASPLVEVWQSRQGDGDWSATAVDSGTEATHWQGLLVRDQDTEVRWYAEDTRGIALTATAAIPARPVYTRVRMNETSGCAVRSDGKTLCFGSGGPRFDSGHVQGQDVVDVAVGQSLHGAGPNPRCTLYPNNRIACDKDTTFALPPIAAAASGAKTNVNSYLDVAAGAEVACGRLYGSGRAVCWGERAMGPPGAGSPQGVSTDGYDQLALATDDFSANSACAIKTSDGSVDCWSQAGTSRPSEAHFKRIAVGCGVQTNDKVSCFAGMAPPPGATGPTSESSGTYKDVAVVGISACAIRASDDRVECWGNGARAPGATSPTGPSSESFVSLSTGVRNICGITTNGAIRCWGRTALTSLYLAPGPLRPPGTHPYAPAQANVSRLELTSVCACAIDEQHALQCRGSSPALCTPPEGDLFSELSMYDRVSCGLTTAGEVKCFGLISPSGPPTPGPYDSVAVDKTYACALRGGEKTCFGDDGAPAPLLLTGTYSQIALHAGVGCGLQDGQLFCVGVAIGAGPDGLGPETLSTTRFTDVTMTRDEGCGIRDDGHAVCWSNSAPTPTIVPLGAASPTGPSVATFRDLVSDEFSVCGVRTDGRVECWGERAGASAFANVDHLSATEAITCGVRDDGGTLCFIAPDEPTTFSY